MSERRMAKTPGPNMERAPGAGSNVRIGRRRPVAVITLDRPEMRNAIDGPTAAQLAAAMRNYEAYDSEMMAKDSQEIEEQEPREVPRFRKASDFSSNEQKIEAVLWGSSNGPSATAGVQQEALRLIGK